MPRNSKKPDTVSMLVFKDHFASRHFEVPLKLFNRLGWTAGILIGSLAVVSFLSIRYFKLYRESDAGRIQGLEQELKFMNQQIIALKAIQKPVESTTASINLPDATTVGPELKTISANKVTDVPIQIEQAQAYFQGGQLYVSFNILYVKNDNGNQQGNIVILAKGPSTIIAYPEGALSDALKINSPPLMSKNGEYFSVSRFRETKAQLTASKDLVSQVEYYLFNTEGKIILSNSIPITTKGKANTLVIPTIKKE